MKILLFVFLLFSFLASCNQNKSTSLTEYFASTDTATIKTGGVQMIEINTPKGKFKVWTKRIGNNPKQKFYFYTAAQVVPMSISKVLKVFYQNKESNLFIMIN